MQTNNTWLKSNSNISLFFQKNSMEKVHYYKKKSQGILGGLIKYKSIAHNI